MPKLKPKKDEPAPPAAPKKQVRFTQEIADRICEEMVNGRDLVDICKDPGMPDRTTVYRWTLSNPAFAAQCARAREALADFELHRLKQIAESCTEENVNSTRVKLNHFQWRLMKIAPRTYGDKVQAEVTGANGGPMQVQALTIDARSLMPEHRQALKQALLAARKAGVEDEEQD